MGRYAPPLLSRMGTHSVAVPAYDAERERVADTDHQHRHGVARHDDDKEVSDGCRVGRVARSALSRGGLIDNIRQRTDRRCTGSGSPQPRACIVVTNVRGKLKKTFTSTLL